MSDAESPLVDGNQQLGQLFAYVAPGNQAS